MSNPYRGEVQLHLCGRACVLRFDWEALACLRQEFGVDYDRKLLMACSEADVETLSKILAIGIKTPEITSEKILASSPPLIPIIEAVDKALTFAFYGQEKPEQKDIKKKSKKQMILFERLKKLLFRLA